MELSKAERKAAKAENRAKKERERLEREFEKNTSSSPVMVTILCVRFGNKYGPEYVERLRNMIERHITIPYELVCLTDDPTPIAGVRILTKRNQGYAKGWWHKVHMFDPTLPLEGRILYMDLDVIICGNIDKIATYKRNDFLGLRDFNRAFFPTWKRLNSSVLSWNAGTQTHIWTEFNKSPMAAMQLHGDQDWIWKTSQNILTFFPDEWIQSYKWEIRDKTELVVYNGKRKFKEARDDIVIPKDCSIVVFHGEPNPSEVNDSFVTENWK